MRPFSAQGEVFKAASARLPNAPSAADAIANALDPDGDFCLVFRTRSQAQAAFGPDLRSLVRETLRVHGAIDNPEQDSVASAGLGRKVPI